MYKFHATILIAGADHPAFATYNPIDDSAIVEFKTGERLCVDDYHHHDVKLYLHGEIDPPQEKVRDSRHGWVTATEQHRSVTGLALEVQGWDVENF